MSNHQAVAAVSATLAQVLRAPAQAAVGTARVFCDRPPADTAPGAAPEVRVFLYRVHSNAARRNDDLPTRDAGGQTVHRPQAALDLDYLLTFSGDEQALEPQLLLGAVVRELHTRPLLDRDDIRAVAAAAGSPVPATDLADQAELVRFTPIGLDLEELSKLWSVFFQSAYRLSVAYQASVVLLTPDETAGPALPVLDPRPTVRTIGRPHVERVVAEAGPRAPVTVGDVLRITGSGLRGEVTWVRIGAERVDPPAADVSDREIRVTVPPTARAGAVGVRVEQGVLAGEPPTERPAAVSNTAVLTLRPRVRRDGFGAYRVSVVVGADGPAVVATVDPAVGLRQQVAVALDQADAAAGATPSAFTVPGPSRDLPGAPEASDTLEVPIPGVPPGRYLVRVVVDGADSPLDRDLDELSPTHEKYVEPTVDVP